MIRVVWFLLAGLGSLVLQVAAQTEVVVFQKSPAEGPENFNCDFLLAWPTRQLALQRFLAAELLKEAPGEALTGEELKTRLHRQEARRYRLAYDRFKLETGNEYPMSGSSRIRLFHQLETERFSVYNLFIVDPTYRARFILFDHQARRAIPREELFRPGTEEELLKRLAAQLHRDGGSLKEGEWKRIAPTWQPVLCSTGMDFYFDDAGKLYDKMSCVVYLPAENLIDLLNPGSPVTGWLKKQVPSELPDWITQPEGSNLVWSTQPDAAKAFRIFGRLTEKRQLENLELRCYRHPDGPGGLVVTRGRDRLLVLRGLDLSPLSLRANQLQIEAGNDVATFAFEPDGLTVVEDERWPAAGSNPRQQPKLVRIQIPGRRLEGWLEPSYLTLTNAGNRIAIPIERIARVDRDFGQFRVRLRNEDEVFGQIPARLQVRQGGATIPIESRRMESLFVVQPISARHFQRLLQRFGSPAMRPAVPAGLSEMAELQATWAPLLADIQEQLLQTPLLKNRSNYPPDPSNLMDFPRYNPEAVRDITDVLRESLHPAENILQIRSMMDFSSRRWLRALVLAREFCNRHPFLYKQDASALEQRLQQRMPPVHPELVSGAERRFRYSVMHRRVDWFDAAQALRWWIERRVDRTDREFERGILLLWKAMSEIP